ncbi:MAG TPA: hypothetical protein VNN55_10225 [bacterium]|nr:hypothetical protein [bacterium]
MLPVEGLAQEAIAPVSDSPPPVVDTLHRPVDPGGEQFRLGGDQAVDTATVTAVRRRLKRQGFFASPTGALLRSVAFPGWGQWSNGKKQKAAVYFAIESYWITKALIWRQRARDADNLADFTHASDRRNYFYWLTGITVFVSMFDAYADRYLLTLEETRDAGDDFWGDRQSNDGWRLALTVTF